MRRSGRPCSTIQDIAAGLHDISYLYIIFLDYQMNHQYMKVIYYMVKRM